MLGRSKKQALDDAVRATAMPATRIVLDRRVDDEHEFAATSSHYGGRPYAEAGDAWPTWGSSGRPYDLVCQIDLRECPSAPPVAFDLFTVFLCWEALEQGDAERACIVRTHVQPDEARAVAMPRPPASDPSDYRVRPCAVRLERTETYPQHPGPDTAVAAALSHVRDPDRAYLASTRRLGFTDPYFSRVGGHPWCVQNDALLEDEGETGFLAQIDYEPEAVNCIGDASPILLVVSADDPMRVLADPFQSF